MKLLKFGLPLVLVLGVLLAIYRVNQHDEHKAQNTPTQTELSNDRTFRSMDQIPEPPQDKLSLSDREEQLKGMIEKADQLLSEVTVEVIEKEKEEYQDFKNKAQENRSPEPVSTEEVVDETNLKWKKITYKDGRSAYELVGQVE
jgi:hypothetical protein